MIDYQLALRRIRKRLRADGRPWALGLILEEMAGLWIENPSESMPTELLPNGSVYKAVWRLTEVDSHKPSPIRNPIARMLVRRFVDKHKDQDDYVSWKHEAGEINEYAIATRSFFRAAQTISRPARKLFEHSTISGVVVVEMKRTGYYFAIGGIGYLAILPILDREAGYWPAVLFKKEDAFLQTGFFLEQSSTIVLRDFNTNVRYDLSFAANIAVWEPEGLRRFDLLRMITHTSFATESLVPVKSHTAFHAVWCNDPEAHHFARNYLKYLTVPETR